MAITVQRSNAGNILSNLANTLSMAGTRMSKDTKDTKNTKDTTIPDGELVKTLKSSEKPQKKRAKNYWKKHPRKESEMSDRKLAKLMRVSNRKFDKIMANSEKIKKDRAIKKSKEQKMADKFSNYMAGKFSNDNDIAKLKRKAASNLQTKQIVSNAKTKQPPSSFKTNQSSNSNQKVNKKPESNMIKNTVTNIPSGAVRTLDNTKMLAELNNDPLVSFIKSAASKLKSRVTPVSQQELMKFAEPVKTINMFGNKIPQNDFFSPDKVYEDFRPRAAGQQNYPQSNVQQQGNWNPVAAGNNPFMNAPLSVYNQPMPSEPGVSSPQYLFQNQFMPMRQYAENPSQMIYEASRFNPDDTRLYGESSYNVKGNPDTPLPNAPRMDMGQLSYFLQGFTDYPSNPHPPSGIDYR